jgi:hypothetical protein
LAEIAIGGQNVAYAVYGTDGGGADGVGSDVYLGSGNNYPGFAISTAQGLGAAVVGSAGDLNADGTPDILIGFPKASSNHGTAFAVYAPEGNLSSVNLDSLPGQSGSQISGAGAADEFGASSASLDGGPDGNPAIIIGAPGATANGFVASGQLRLIESSALAGSTNPATGTASSSNSTRCQTAARAKPFTGPKSLPQCRMTAAGRQDRSGHLQRSRLPEAALGASVGGLGADGRN